MGNKHSSQKFAKSLSNNHTLKFLADPFKPVEKIVSAAHDDAKDVVHWAGNAGSAIVGDIGTLSGGLSQGFASTPLIIGGVAIAFLFMNRQK